MPESKKPLDDDAEEKLLKVIRRRFEYCREEWAEIRKEGAEDMRYIAGDPWAENDKRSRIAAGRPALALDELNQYVNQIINEVRQNKRAIKISPARYGATEETAKFRGNLVRQIEYASHAQMAYTAAFENAVQRSYGYFRVRTQFESDRSFDQEIRIDMIPNPDLVFPDPDAQRPDSSDMRYLFNVEHWPHEKFRTKFPFAEVHDFNDYFETHKDWVKQKTVQLAEYYTIEHKAKKLLLMQPPPVAGQPASPPMAVFEDELKRMPVGAQLIRDRLVDVPTVIMYLTNGIEVLEKTEWPGKFIPFVSMYGKVIYVNDGGGTRRRMLSMVRLARDPYMLYCFYRSCEAELVGMTPKTPYVGYEGQFRGHEGDWQKVAHEPLAYLEARAITEGTGNQILPLPQRQQYDPPIQALEVGAEAARRAIQSAMGQTPLPTTAQRRNEKSGVALKQIEETAQRGSYHFIDHYDDALRQCGAIIDDLIPRIYDTARDIGVRQPDDSPDVIRINDDQVPQGQQPMHTDQGEYDVTISVGAKFDSEREQASDFADTLVASPVLQQVAALSGPQAAGKILSLAVKLKNLGPIGEEIANTISPQPTKDGQPSVQQLQVQLQQAGQQIEAMTKELEGKTRAVETDQVKSQAELQKESMRQEGETGRSAAELASKERQFAIEQLVELAKAELAAKSKADATMAVEHGEMVRDALGMEHEHQQNTMQREQSTLDADAERQQSAGEAEADRQFQREEGEAGRAFEEVQAERERQAALEQADLTGGPNAP